MAQQSFEVQKKNKDGNWQDIGSFSRDFCLNANHFRQRGLRVKPGQDGWEYTTADLVVEKKVLNVKHVVGEPVLKAEKEIEEVTFPPIDDAVTHPPVDTDGVIVTSRISEVPAVEKPKRGPKPKVKEVAK